MFEVQDLSPLSLPDDYPILRDAVIKPNAQKPDFAEKYDWTTLVYGAVKVSGGLVLVCPKLFNLRSILKGGRFTAGGDPLRIRRISRFRRHDEVWLSGPVRGDTLRFTYKDLDLTGPIRAAWPGFAGRRCLITTSKDNELDWITDWVRHYVRHQGAQAVLFYDNASTRYGPQDVLERLRGVNGLEAAQVVSVPCRYGQLGNRPPRGIGKFLQSGLLNLARHGACADARTVLQCDVDEMAMTEEGRPTLFEAAEAGWLGYATAKAYWRTSPPRVDGGMPRYGDHILGWSPERSTKEKWALVPKGPLRRFGWDVHGVGRYQFNDLVMQKGTRFLHCERLSNNWKRARSEENNHLDAIEDPATRAFWERVGLRAPSE